MPKKQNKNILAIGVGLLVCLIVIGFSGSIQGGSYRYKIRPEITLPEYQTDTVRVIDAYERLMEHFISMTEKNLIGVNTDIRDISKRLFSINRSLEEISRKISGIEKALGIEQSDVQVEKTSTPYTPSIVADSDEPES